ncbi:uncharacterized protein [Palaemon carinicauda]|uniref:uncharacterized protein n=1 Tax=Palaemon carinicauda TaxID=392227 RepID=UPI0035B6276C
MAAAGEEDQSATPSLFSRLNPALTLPQPPLPAPPTPPGCYTTPPPSQFTHTTSPHLSSHQAHLAEVLPCHPPPPTLITSPPIPPSGKRWWKPTLGLTEDGSSNNGVCGGVDVGLGATKDNDACRLRRELSSRSASGRLLHSTSSTVETRHSRSGPVGRNATASWSHSKEFQGATGPQECENGRVKKNVSVRAPAWSWRRYAFFASALVLGVFCPGDAFDLASCKEPLGMESGKIKDEQITASSAYDVSVTRPDLAR